MGEFFQCRIPNIESFIDDLDRVRAELNPAIDEALDNGAELIMQEQRRIISQKSHRLSSYIKRKSSKTTKGKMRYSIGYIYDESTVDDVMPGLVFEFGRPGKSKNRGTIEREVNGKTYEVRNGYIPEYSHIRRGFDNKIDEANEILDNTFSKVVDNLGGEKE